MFPLESHTIFLALAGSQAHGTAREGSDVDVRGICVAPLTTRLSLFQHFEQYEGALPDAFAAQVLPRLRAHPTASRALEVKSECVIFDVAKFVGLCAATNPNALEVLFSDERDWLWSTASWQKLYEHRHQFLTQKLQQTFLGYAMAQLKRIQTHRSWLLNPPAKKPVREDFGLSSQHGTLTSDDQNRIEQSVAEAIQSYGIDTLDMPKATRVALQERLTAFQCDALSASADELEQRLRAVATIALNIPLDVVTTLNAEKRYRAATKHWDSYQNWKSQRNPTRAELERRHGYDTKHAMHLIRLMRMGLEALRHGELHVRRDDSEELSAIRDGALTYEALLNLATELQRAMHEAALTTELPPDIDAARVDALLADILLAA